MKNYCCLLFLLCLGCGKKPSTSAFKVNVTGKNTVQVTNIDDNTLIDLKQDSVDISQWQSLLPLYRMPADTDMKDYQQPQPGRYAFKNNTVIFTADTPFVKHQKYFMRLYRLEKDNSSLAVIKGSWKHNSIPYTEYVFIP